MRGSVTASAGQGVYADLLMRRFTRATRQWGLDEAREGLDCSQIRRAGRWQGEDNRGADVAVLA